VKKRSNFSWVTVEALEKSNTIWLWLYELASSLRFTGDEFFQVGENIDGDQEAIEKDK